MSPSLPRLKKDQIKSVIYRIGIRFSWIERSAAWQRTIQTNWKEVEYFDEDWKSRIAVMAELIPANAFVVDFGCGKQWLRSVVEEDRYTGVDYVPRSENTLVCDLNKYQFPDGEYDVAFISGALEFVKDVQWFIEKVTQQFKVCIISYCATDDTPSRTVRRRSGWVNDLSEEDIILAFKKHGFTKTHAAESYTTSVRNRIYKFEKQH